MHYHFTTVWIMRGNGEFTFLVIWVKLIDNRIASEGIVMLDLSGIKHQTFIIEYRIIELSLQSF